MSKHEVIFTGYKDRSAEREIDARFPSTDGMPWKYTFVRPHTHNPQANEIYTVIAWNIVAARRLLDKWGSTRRSTGHLGAECVSKASYMGLLPVGSVQAQVKASKLVDRTPQNPETPRDESGWCDRYKYTFEVKWDDEAHLLGTVIEHTRNAASGALRDWLYTRTATVRPTIKCLHKALYTGVRAAGSVEFEHQRRPVKERVDLHADRARRENISREEAKRRNFVDIYNSLGFAGADDKQLTGRVKDADFAVLEARVLASMAALRSNALPPSCCMDQAFFDGAEEDQAKHRPARWEDGHGWVNLYVNKNGVVQAGGIYTSAQKAREISANKKSAPTLIAWDVATNPNTKTPDKPAKAADRDNTTEPDTAEAWEQRKVERAALKLQGRGAWFYEGYKSPLVFSNLSLEEVDTLATRLKKLASLNIVGASFGVSLTSGGFGLGSVRVSFSSGRYPAVTEAYRKLLTRQGIVWTQPSVACTECSLDELMRKVTGGFGLDHC
jgi:hypothetical protein